MNAEGSTTQVTRELHAPSNFKWSPDGAYIHFQRLVPHSNPWPIDLPAPPEGANWTPPPRSSTGSIIATTASAFLEEGFTHLFRVPSGGGTARQLTSGQWNAGSTFVPGVGNVGYDLTPDGGTLLFDGNMEDADNLYRESHIYALDLAAERSASSRPSAAPGPPDGLADGRRIAYTGFPWTSQTYKTTELYVMDLDGGNAASSPAISTGTSAPCTGPTTRRGVFFTAGIAAPERPLRDHRRRCDSGHRGRPHALAHLGHAGRAGRRHAHSPAQARRCRRIRPEQPWHDHAAHRSQRRSSSRTSDSATWRRSGTSPPGARRCRAGS